MSDRELLELAAKAAGYVDLAQQQTGWNGFIGLRVLDSEYDWKDWNPLEDDGDALRLAVKLGLRIDTPKYKGFGSTAGNMTVFRDGCPYAQTRRAVVMAAAEIGKQMTEPSK